MEFNDTGAMTQAFLLDVKKKCIYFSYGNFDGLRVPSLEEMHELRRLLDNAIRETADNENHRCY